MPEEIVRRRIIVDTPMESNDNHADDNNGRSKKLPKRVRANNLKKQLEELYSKGKLIHKEIRYYVEVLGIDIGNIKVDVDNYMEVLMACDKEARRRGFLF